MSEPRRDGALLRPWTTSDRDVAAVLAAFADEGVARQAAAPVTDADAARAWIERRTTQVERDVSLAIDVHGTAVGGVRISSIDREHELQCWIGYWLAPEARGRGLASRATATLARWAFDELGLERINLVHRVNNPESGAVARRAGFIHEGVQRGRLRFEGRRYDVAMCGRLHTDPEPMIELLPIVGTSQS